MRCFFSYRYEVNEQNIHSFCDIDKKNSCNQIMYLCAYDIHNKNQMNGNVSCV